MAELLTALQRAKRETLYPSGKAREEREKRETVPAPVMAIRQRHKDEKDALTTKIRGENIDLEKDINAKRGKHPAFEAHGHQIFGAQQHADENARRHDLSIKHGTERRKLAERHSDEVEKMYAKMQKG